jgi:hypothetical protein
MVIWAELTYMCHKIVFFLFSVNFYTSFLATNKKVGFKAWERWILVGLGQKVSW